MAVLDALKPKEVFQYFEEISNIPRGSGNEKAVSDFLMSFAKEKGLEAKQDTAYNVFIKKGGTFGYENAPPVIIQGHMDMVCDKNAETEHDFLKDPIRLRIIGDFVMGTNTTLGADDGIAVAYAMALLASNDIPHPPLEAVLTTGEEVGMLGASAFDAGLLKGRTLINLDTTLENSFLAGCAGGVRSNICLPIEWKKASENMEAFSITIKGLKGGHSGEDINTGRANANKLMGRVLRCLCGKQHEFCLARISGGTMDNAITRESEAVILCNPKDSEEIRMDLLEIENVFKTEFKKSDGGINIEFEYQSKKLAKVFSSDTLRKVISILILIPYGVQSMSMDMEDLVESSSNIGVLRMDEKEVVFESAVRSSLAIRKGVIKDKLKEIAYLTGSRISFRADYPAWPFNPESRLLDIFRTTFKEMYGKEPNVSAIHAGLECGVFSDKIPGMDIISAGPDAFDIHTPDERLSISSTERFWRFLQEILKKLK